MGLSSCATTAYLWQAGKGQFAISNRARPLETVKKDPRTSPEIRALLSQVPDIKRFAESRGLRATRNYEEYVALDREASNWVVTASEELAFRPKVWSFPIVGSFNYLGWFDLGQARAAAEELRKEGWDVDVRGARAYSTLGWFRDPILSTMIEEGEFALPALAEVLFHESTHATVYVKDQLPFNESLAEFAASRLLQEYFSVDPARAHAKEAWRIREERGVVREARFRAAYQELSALYSSSVSPEEKRVKKREILGRLEKEVVSKRPITNATLIQFQTYSADPVGFAHVFQSCGEDWARFWRAMRTVGKESFERTQQEDLAALLQRLRDPCAS